MATSLLPVELDPLFSNALRLLRSKQPESAKELKDLVQDYREKVLGGGNKKDGNGRQSPKVDTKVNTRINPISINPTTGNASDNKRPAGAVSLMESLKEVSFEAEHKGNQVTEVEESIEEITLGSSLQPALKRKKTAGTHENMLGISSPESDVNDSIPIDQIIEMDFAGPSCVTCHLGKRSEDDNVLMECSECRSSYHQKCHKPIVTTKEVNDPRLIWYCSKCMKKMKKEMAAQQASNNKAIESNTPPQKTAVSNPFQQSKPFRRPSAIPTPDLSKVNNNTTTSTSSTSDTCIAIGTATVEESSSSSSSSTSSREGSPSQAASGKYNRNKEMAKQAMNRLEQVRKRAKMQHALKQAARK